jgi:hypothetical protein
MIGINQVNDTLPARPLLAVEKAINGSIVQANSIIIEPNVTIRVNITIKNIGNRTAYNLTIVDPAFESWVLRSLNLTTQRFVQVDINATIFYFYYFTALVEGNFTIEPTEVTYTGKNRTEIREYLAKSVRFLVESVEDVDIVLIEGELWRKILYYCLGISGTVSLIVVVDYIILRRRKEKAKPKKPKKAEPVQQKSIQEIKKKRTKRR